MKKQLLIIISLLVLTFNAYSLSRAIIIDNSGNTNALNDQIKIQLNADNFDFSHANTDASDIYFKSKTGTDLYFYIESYSQCAKLGIMWVKVNSISASVIDTIYMYYGNTCSHFTSSFANTMRRMQTSDDSIKYLVRFNDGTGTTASNALGGAVNLIGGYTWNTGDTYSENTGSLTFNGTSGYAEKSGLLDDWGTEGHIKMRFKYVGSNTPALWSKHNRLSTSSTDLGDFVDLQIAATLKLQLQCFAGAGSKLTVNGQTLFQKGNTYEVSFVWNQYQLFLYVNGQLDGSYYSRTPILPPSGSATPFRIACSSDNTTGNPALFFNCQINDFVYQKFQPYKSKIISFHENRNYFQKDEASKWIISRTPEFGGTSTDATTETSIQKIGSLYALYYGRVTGTNQARLFVRTCTSLNPNSNNIWSAETQVYPNYVRTHSIHKFGSTYYCYFRNAVAAGPMLVATSTDGYTFTGSATVLPQPSSGFGSLGFYNNAVLNDGINYKMIVSDVDPLLTYAIGTAVGSSPTSTYSLDCLNPKYSMANGFSFGAPSLNKVNGLYQMWFHQVNKVGVLPSEIYRSSSSDFINWQASYSDPVLIRERPNEYDQASDPYVTELDGACYISYLQGTNVGTFKGYVNIGKFNGTLSQLVTDLTYQIGAEF